MPRPHAFLTLLTTFAIFALHCPGLSAAEALKRTFNVPAGDAQATLREFSRQARVQLLFDVDKLNGVRTVALRGNYTPRDGLSKMLEGTRLQAVQDEKSGALTVRRSPGPNERRTAAANAGGDRPKNADLARAAVPSTGAGAIEGRVSSARGEFLERARVSIEGTAIETFSDADGYFRLHGVPAGDARVRVFFTGFQPQVIVVRVSEGQTATHDFSLGARAAATANDGTIKLAEFVISASKEMSGAALAINEQRFADNIKNVLSTDEFGFVPEGNVAEFLKFIPGVTIEYSGGNARDVSIGGVPAAYVPITLDGFNVASVNVEPNTARNVTLDMLSVNNLSRVEVIYSPTPESPGTALAGSVNMVPRSSFERARPVFNGSVYLMTRSTEHDFHKTPGPRTSPSRKVNPGFDFNYVVPVNKRFGFALSGGHSINAYPQPFAQTVWRGASAPTNANFPATTPDQPYLTSYTYRDSTKITDRSSMAVTVDYKLTRYDRISFGFQYSYTNIIATNQTLAFALTRVLPGEFSLLATRSAPGQAELQLTNVFRERHNRTAMPTFVWRHDGPIWKSDLGLGVSLATNRNRDVDKGSFTSTSGFRRNLTIAFDGMIDARPREITVIDNATGAIIDPSLITGKTFNSGSANPNDTSDVQRTAYANLSRDFGGPVPIRLKSGIHVRQSARDNRGVATGYTYLGPDGNAATDESAAPFLDPVYAARDGAFGFPRIEGISNALTWQRYQTNPEQFAINENNHYRSSVTNSKFAEEIVSAAYLRGDVSFFSRRLKLVGGVRAEQTNIEAEGPLTDPARNNQRDAQGNVILVNNRPVPIVANTNSVEYSRLTFIDRGTRVEKEYLRLFPSLNASFSLRENLIARAAVYRSAGRPNLNQYAGGLTLPNIEDDPAQNVRIQVNNAGIKPWSALTTSVRLEYYFEGVGQLSLSAFRRDFENFFGATRFPVTPAFLALYGIDPDLYGHYDVETQYNVPGVVRMEGSSISYKQALTFLPAWARGVQVFANASHQRRTGALVGNSGFNFFPRSASWGVSLTREKYQARLNWNYRDRRRGAATTGASIGPETYEWLPKQVTLDADAEYYFYKRFAVFVSFRNATNVTEETEIYGPLTPDVARFRSRIDYGTLWTLGIKGTF